jgi:SHS2 domain-containing protein
MNSRKAGFREKEHTADWELEAWAPDLAGLFEQAARGMYALTGARLKAGPRLSRRLAVQATDPESLLVSFLAELLYLGEVEGAGFDHFAIHLAEGGLQAELGGAPLAGQVKEIKAVTYHNLAIKKTESGYEANVVFDV